MANDGLIARRPAVYRGRFAPSPTGPLHLGSLFTAVASHLQARSLGGEWLLRIDDLDPERSLPEAADSIRHTLERFGLYWDQEIVFQRRNTEHYQRALEHLGREALVYPCDCSRKELAARGLNAVYPGFCRDKITTDRKGTSYALRLRVGPEMIRFNDRLHGMVSQDLVAEVGDFVVRRRDGVFAYHLATVVDDADANITEIVRGIDLLDVTPRQICLQRLLGLPEPDYCHVPVITDEAGCKLSKQTFAAAVETHEPSQTLSQVLGLLRHPPPDELAGAPTGEILRWAVEHWHIDQLKGIQAICPAVL